MDLKDWNDLSPEDQGAVFTREMQLQKFYEQVEERNKWAVKQAEIMWKIKMNQEHYERNVLGIPQAFIDMDKGGL